MRVTKALIGGRVHIFAFLNRFVEIDWISKEIRRLEREYMRLLNKHPLKLTSINTLVMPLLGYSWIIKWVMQYDFRNYFLSQCRSRIW